MHAPTLLANQGTVVEQRALAGAAQRTRERQERRQHEPGDANEDDRRWHLERAERHIVKGHLVGPARCEDRRDRHDDRGERGGKPLEEPEAASSVGV
jgi:hypothetical protein